MFKLPIPTRLTDYLGEAVVWTVITVKQSKVRISQDQGSTYRTLNFSACPENSKILEHS